MIGTDPIKPLRACGEPAKDVAAADDDADLDAQRVDVLDLVRDTSNNLRINAEALFAHQDFATEFKQNPFIFRFQQPLLEYPAIRRAPLAHLLRDRFDVFPDLRLS